MPTPPSKSMNRSSAAKVFIVSLIMLLSFTVIGKNAKATLPTNNGAINKVESYNASLGYSIYQQVYKAGADISEEVFALAFKGFEKLSAAGRLSTDSILTIIDFSRSSREKRMFVIDLKAETLLFKTVVAHGRNTGEEYAFKFSNNMNSHQSSLGFYITKSTYTGSNGYSLMLDGIEQGINDKALSRAIVMHGAEYASEKRIGNKGYLGRSFGCPALPKQINKQVIDKIKQGNCIFIYYPDQQYLSNSKILNG